MRDIVAVRLSNSPIRGGILADDIRLRLSIGNTGGDCAITHDGPIRHSPEFQRTRSYSGYSDSLDWVATAAFFIVAAV